MPATILHTTYCTSRSSCSDGSYPPLPVATPDKKEDKLPVNVTPAATIDPKQDETKKTECDDHYGVYFGLGLGMANLGGKFSATGLTSGNISDTGLAKYSMTGDLHIGYLHKFGDFGIGVESYFDPLKMKSTNNYTGTGGAAQSYTVTLKNTFGFSMSCGYFIGEKTLGYIKAGFEKQKFTFTIVDNNTTALSDSKNQNTLAGGLGIRHQMGNWAVGAEYIYTKYKDMTSQNGGVSTSLKPNSNAIRFTLAYVI
ncbi:MAG: hypothetical protein KBD31_02340 [Proteobacteria bacterium]|nr:hypothetical protein [Pseudomonadota bacterium]